MFRTEKPWLEVYGGRVEPETEFFEGSLYDLFRNCIEERERAGMGMPSATGGPAPPPSPS